MTRDIYWRIAKLSYPSSWPPSQPHLSLRYDSCGHQIDCTYYSVEWKRNLMAHGDAREEKWRGKRRMVWVVSSFQFDSEQSIQCYYNRSPTTLTPRKPVLDWTDNPADINGLVRFAGRPNLVSARVPSHPVFTLLRSKMDERNIRETPSCEWTRDKLYVIHS